MKKMSTRLLTPGLYLWTALAGGGCYLLGLEPVPCVDDDNCLDGLVCVVDTCKPRPDGGPALPDGGQVDAGPPDAGDAGHDAGDADAGPRDAGHDAGDVDAGDVDAGDHQDAGGGDAGDGEDAGAAPCQEGQRAPGELCFDGFLDDGSGCSSPDNTVEPGFCCVGPPTVCYPFDARLFHDDFERADGPVGVQGEAGAPWVVVAGAPAIQGGTLISTGTGATLRAPLDHVVGAEKTRLRFALQLGAAEDESSLMVDGEDAAVSGSGLKVRGSSAAFLDTLSIVGQGGTLASALSDEISPNRTYFAELHREGIWSLATLAAGDYASAGGRLLVATTAHDTGAAAGREVYLDLVGGSSGIGEVRVDRTVTVGPVEHLFIDTFSRASTDNLGTAEHPPIPWTADQGAAYLSVSSGALTCLFGSANCVATVDQTTPYSYDQAPLRVRARVTLGFLGAGGHIIDVRFNSGSNVASSGAGFSLNGTQQGWLRVHHPSWPASQELSLDNQLQSNQEYFLELIVDGFSATLTMHTDGYGAPGATTLQVLDMPPSPGGNLVLVRFVGGVGTGPAAVHEVVVDQLRP